MRYLSLVLALCLVGCGDPASNTGDLDGSAGADAGVDEARAWALCRLDGGQPVFSRDWPASARPPECASAERIICTPEMRAVCPSSDLACCHREEHCGVVRYIHCR